MSFGAPIVVGLCSELFLTTDNRLNMFIQRAFSGKRIHACLIQSTEREYVANYCTGSSIIMPCIFIICFTPVIRSCRHLRSEISLGATIMTYTLTLLRADYLTSIWFDFTDVGGRRKLKRACLFYV